MNMFFTILFHHPSKIVMFQNSNVCVCVSRNRNDKNTANETILVYDIFKSKFKKIYIFNR